MTPPTYEVKLGKTHTARAHATHVPSSQAMASSGDSVIKCPFCDTPFISKGAYRHHLSKMHFTKEAGGGPGAGGQAPAAARTPSPEAGGGAGAGALQTKYQKYAQLAKQLSCNTTK